MTDQPNPALAGVPPPSWSCVGCTASFVWQARAGDEKSPPSLVHDRAPFNVEVDGKAHACCTRECARNVWFVKSLEALGDRLVPAMAHAVLHASDRIPRRRRCRRKRRT